MKIMRAWDRGKNNVAVLFRNEETGRLNIKDIPFEWYFYVKNEDYEREKHLFKKFTGRYISRIEQESHYTKIFVPREHKSESLNLNNEMVWDYIDWDLRELLEKLAEFEIQTYEADILPWKRFVIDSNIEIDSEYKILFLDIETDDSIFNSKITPGEFRIISCAFTDGQTGKSKWICIDELTDDAEKAFLIKMAKIINGYDVLIAWNSENFDMGYIKERFKKYNIEIDWRKKFWQDHLQIFRKLGPPQASYSLEHIANTFLDEGKVKHEEKLIELFHQDKKKLKAYNLQDTRLLYLLEGKTKFLGVAREVNKIGSCFVDDIYISRKIDMLVLKKAKEIERYHFKTKEKKQDEDRDYAGAFVVEPELGFHKSIIIADYSSLYPSIIKTLNLSPDTLLDSPTEDCIKSPNGFYFSKEHEGILPGIVSLTSERRSYYKNLMKTVSPDSNDYKTYDKLQYVFKYYGLSFYGVVGMQGSRFYDRRIAETITLTGQYMIKSMKKYVERCGKRVVYGDSVTKDRYTLIAFDGRIRLVTFEELFKMTSRDEIIGQKQYGYFDKPIYTLSYNFKEQKSEFKQIIKIIRHITDKQIYIYRNRHGVTRVTEDHSLIDSAGNEFPPTQYEREAFRCPIMGYKKWTNKIIDLKDYIGKYTLHSKSGNRQSKDLVFENGYAFFPNHTVKFKTMLDLNDREKVKRFIKFLAHYICNGSSCTQETTLSRFGASIASNDIELIQELKEIYHEWFEGTAVNTLKANGKFRDDLFEKHGYMMINQTNKLQMMNTLSAVVLRGLCGQKAYGKFIPDFIYMLDDELQKFFFDELIEGDGNIDKKSGRFSFETSSNKLISGMSIILNNLKINYSLRYNIPDKTYIMKEYDGKNSHCGKHLAKNYCHPIQYEDYVYDLEVKDNHNFIDACGGILLHNTDSIFIDGLEDNEIDNLITNIQKVSSLIATKKFNSNNSFLEMAFDKKFDTWVIISKKRYAGMLSYVDGRKLPEPKLYVAGLEYKRTDNCQIVRDSQKKLLLGILQETMTLKDIHDFIYELKNNCISKKLTLEQITFAQKLTKNIEEYKAETMNIKVAKEMLQDGKEVWIGDKIQYFVIATDKDKKGIPVPIYKFKGKYDPIYYWNKKIFPPLQRILEVVYKDEDWNKYLVNSSGMKNTAVGRSLKLWQD